MGVDASLTSDEFNLLLGESYNCTCWFYFEGAWQNANIDLQFELLRNNVQAGVALLLGEDMPVGGDVWTKVTFLANGELDQIKAEFRLTIVTNDEFSDQRIYLDAVTVIRA